MVVVLVTCVCVCVCARERARALSPTLCYPMDCSPQDPLSLGFSRQEYWSELPFPSPGDIPNPGIESGSSTLQADSLQMGVG